MKIVLFYLLQVALIIDQAFNVLLGGYADETLSSRAYRAWRGEKIFGKIFKPLIDTIFFWDPDHCRTSYLAEIQKKQLPREFTKWINE
jgi:hypothetical protein